MQGLLGGRLGSTGLARIEGLGIQRGNGQLVIAEIARGDVLDLGRRDLLEVLQQPLLGIDRQLHAPVAAQALRLAEHRITFVDRARNPLRLDAGQLGSAI